jgi:large subunit ribosomal protein L18
MIKEQSIKKKNRLLRARRVKSKLFGTAKKPRLSVKISNQHVFAQMIDDESAKTLTEASSLKLDPKLTLTKKAEAVGAEIAKKAKAVKVKQVVFDRGWRKYHGRIKALADSARNNGLEF